ncbi:MAG: MFS transporter [Alteromonadaceae bacterium]|nr:MFS transporter [Alteromonadaceae bacterium]
MSSSSSRPPLVPMVATGMLCTIVLVVFARLAYGLVLPAMREGLGLSYAAAANLGTVTALGYLILVMVAGAFAARWGARLAIIIGLCLATTGFVGLSLVSDYVALMVMMTLLGFGTAFGYTPLISLLGSWFPNRRGAVIGFANGGVGLGMLIAGALVPYLTSGQTPYDWRTVWALFACAGALVLVVAIMMLRNPPVHNATSDSAQIPLPLVRAGVYKNPHVITVGLVYGVVGATYIVQSLFMFSYTLDSGIPALTAGRLASMMGLLAIFAGPAWGWISDHIGRSNSLVLSMGFSFLGQVLPVIWPTLPVFVAHYVILGLCMSGLFTSVLAASTETVHPRHAAVAVSFVTLFFATGQLLGPALAGPMIEWTGGFRTLFACTSLLMLGSIFLCWHTRKSATGGAPATANLAQKES